MKASEAEIRPRGVVWALDLEAPLPAISPRVAARFGPAGLESVGELARAGAMGGISEIKQRFQSGRRCYAAWAGSQLAAYGWVSTGEEYVGELDLCLDLLAGEAYIWDCFTAPAFRRNLLYSALLVFILGELRTGPFCRAWIGADFDNTPSQRGIARAGFLRVADLMVAESGGERVAWLQGRPDAPEDLVAEARRLYLGGAAQISLAARAAVSNMEAGPAENSITAATPVVRSAGSGCPPARG